MKRAREKAPTEVITVEDLDREIDALRAQEQAWKREARRFEAMVKEIQPQLYALVSLKKSLTVRRVAPAEGGGEQCVGIFRLSTGRRRS